VWTAGGSSVFSQTVTTTSVLIPAGVLQHGVSYYWGVTASNSAGTSIVGSVLYFKVN
jgi:hypothetical protein